MELKDAETTLASLQEKQYPDELVAIAQQFFQWLCEEKENNLALTRLNNSDTEKEISFHTELTQLLASDLSRAPGDRGNMGWVFFTKFCKSKDIDEDQFDGKRKDLNSLLIQASLQYHLSYHDYFSGESRYKFRFSIFQETWTQIREPKHIPSTFVSTESIKPPGRPGINYAWLTEQLKSLENAEELPPLEGGWRIEVARMLKDKYTNEYSGEGKLRNPPKAQTISDKMRDEFDALKDRYDQKY